MDADRVPECVGPAGRKDFSPGGTMLCGSARLSPLTSWTQGAGHASCRQSQLGPRARPRPRCFRCSWGFAVVLPVSREPLPSCSCWSEYSGRRSQNGEGLRAQTAGVHDTPSGSPCPFWGHVSPEHLAVDIPLPLAASLATCLAVQASASLLPSYPSRHFHW